MAKKPSAMVYYDTARIRKTDSHYHLIFGERSNGKTTAVLCDILRNHVNGKGNGQYVRQMDIDIRGARGENIFRSLEYGGPNKDRNLIEECTDGQWTTTKYRSRAWYLGRQEEDKDGNVQTVYASRPFCFASALNQVAHDKSATPADVTTIVFDEFLPINGSYLVDETALFRNMVSTTVRDAERTKIFLVANSLGWNSPYFKMFGITESIRGMNPGDMKLFELPQADSRRKPMRVAVEYCIDSASTTGGKASDVYFAFPDQHSAMITGGKFAVPDYPKCPHHFSRTNVKITYWFDTEEEDRSVLRCRLMKVGRDVFMFVDRVTDEVHQKIRDDRRDVFYAMKFSGSRGHYISPLHPTADGRTKWMASSIASGRMFFETNEIGEDFTYFVKRAAEMSILSL